VKPSECGEGARFGKSNCVKTCATLLQMKGELVPKPLDVSFCYRNEECNEEVGSIDILERNSVFTESIAQEATSEN